MIDAEWEEGEREMNGPGAGWMVEGTLLHDAAAPSIIGFVTLTQ